MANQLVARREAIGIAGLGLAAVVAAVNSRPANAKFAVSLSGSEWRKRLGSKRYAVLREAATEAPWSSPLNDEHRRGTFVCAGCALPLYDSSTKFESHTGWPSFWKPLPNAVVTRPDHKLFAERTEVLCRRCGGHLGHVFNDGPKPTGLRYCMNGLALRFHPA
jgi:peptide-methionine (R)-S-oxide reductase